MRDGRLGKVKTSEMRKIEEWERGEKEWETERKRERQGERQSEIRSVQREIKTHG